MRPPASCTFQHHARTVAATIATLLLLTMQPGIAHAQETPLPDTFLPIVNRGNTPQPTPTFAPGAPTHTPIPTRKPTRAATPLYPTQPPPGSTATHTPRGSATPTPTRTPTPPPGSTATPTPAPTPTRTPVPTATFAAQASPVLLSLTIFEMGCEAEKNGVEIDPACWSEQQPAHLVTVNALRIDRYEVTNRRYKACVDASACAPPQSTASATRPHYYGTDAFADYPVLYVTWQQAQTFCAWAGGRLPTEAEWEKAARHPSDGRVYPWGNTAPTCAHTNLLIDASGNQCGVNDTTRIASYPLDTSFYGMADMGGNVAEWVQDWYLEDYYETSPRENPQGPAAGTVRVVRGGSWMDQQVETRATRRSWSAPTASYPIVGFRCVYAP